MSDKPCVLCNHNIDDVLQFGEKFTSEDTTAHLYCLLLTSNLVQNGDDDEGINGFMPKDIKSEVSRTKKLYCHFCHEKGATIGCCIRSCRKSFHLPCALKNECRLEFTGTFKSFCDVHHGIEDPKIIHKSSDLCTVCYDEMGPYNRIQSIPLPCCNKNSWCHKLCLQKYAQTSGYFLKCPLCNDSKYFRDFISQRGVFIPDSDAKWEADDSGTNPFYNFEEQSMRPSECVAKVCKCKKGRKYKVDIEHHKHSIEFCHYCGSHAIHLGCLKGDQFLCEVCTTIVKQIRENAVNVIASTSSDRGSLGTSRNSASHSNTNRMNLAQIQNNDSGIVVNESDDEMRFKSLKSVHNIREFSICLRRLTPSDFGFKFEPIESSCQTDDDIEIKPSAQAKKRKNMPIISISSSDTDEEIIPTKKKRMHKSPFTESELDERDSEFDINDNFRDMPSSSSPVTDNSLALETKPKINSLYMRQYSTSDEEQVRPTGSNSNLSNFTSSDNQSFGKENEKPIKSVAVVRPFSQNESSSEDCIKPAKINARRRIIISSSDELDPPKLEINDCSSENINACDNTKPSSAKKKRRKVRSYFRESISSGDEYHLPQKKKKSPKINQRSPKKLAPTPSNQTTIMRFFKKQCEQNTQMFKKEK